MGIASFINKFSGYGFAKKIFFGTFWLTFGSLVSRGLLSLAYIVLARLFSVSEYGEFGMIRSTIDNFLNFASLGIGLTATKYISELKDNDKQKASSILGASLSLVLILALLVALLLAFSSGFISSAFLSNPGLQMPLVVGGFTLVFVAFNSTQAGALLGFQAYRRNSLSNMSQGLFLVLGLVAGGYMGGVQGALWGNLLALIPVSLIYHAQLKMAGKAWQVGMNLNEWASNTKTIFRFAIPASLSTIIVAPAVWLLNIMLVNQPEGYEELGLYSAVIIFSTTIQMFNGAIGNVLLPLFLSDAEKKSPKKEFFNYFGSWVISIFLSFPLILFPELVSFILGDKYDLQDIAPILGMSVIATLTITSRGGVIRDLIMKNKMWLSVFSMGQWAVTNIVIFYLLRGYGAAGFAFSFMISYLINYLVFVPFFIYRKISPPVIFFSKWNLLLWVSLISLAAVCSLLYDRLAYRIPLSVILTGMIVYSIINLYRECLKKL